MRRSPARMQPRSAIRKLYARMLKGAAFVAVAAVALATASPASANTAPKAVNDFLSVVKDQQLEVLWTTLYENDAPGQGASFQPHGFISVNPLHGTVDSAVFTAVGMAVVYTPEPGYVGTDSMTYIAFDTAGGSSDPATIEVLVTTAAPIAEDDSYSMVAGQLNTVDASNGVLANDKDEDGETLYAGYLLSNNVNGVLHLQPDVSFSYTPDAGFSGLAGFWYQAIDSSGARSHDVHVDLHVAALVPSIDSIAFTAPQSGVAGSLGSVTASITSLNGVKKGAILDLRIDDATSGSSAFTDADGNAQIPFTYPAAGPHTLKVESADGSVSFSTPFTSLPKPALPPVAAKVTSLALGAPAGKPGQVVTLVSKITSATSSRAGAVVIAYIDGKKVAVGTTDVTGTAKISVRLPYLAGKHTVKVVAGDSGMAQSKSITLGQAASAKLGSLKAVKAKKTQTITGSFGVVSGKVTIKVTDPKGKVRTKTVSVNSAGKFSYKYTTSKKGTYTVRYSYVANATAYGAKVYAASFTAK